MSWPDLGTLSDLELAELAADVAVEQRRRLLDRGDLPTVADAAFDRCFDHKGAAGDPELTDDGLLVCPGSVVPKSKQVHLSRFVVIGEDWVWDAGECVHDEVRRGEGPAMRTISLVGVTEGMEFHVIDSKGPSGNRSLVTARSFRITGGEPEMITTRVPAPAGRGR